MADDYMGQALKARQDKVQNPNAWTDNPYPFGNPWENLKSGLGIKKSKDSDESSSTGGGSSNAG